MLLDTIHSREDLLAVPEQQLPALCEEIRQFLVQNVSRTGGHLASNLGIVETTVAIHRVFDTSRDRLVFDVGHQCYVHKMLTGRMDRFDTLRQQGGLSGFPKPCESVHDAFIAGHASIRRILSDVDCRRKNVISPGTISPSSVPCVTSSGRLLAMIF